MAEAFVDTNVLLYLLSADARKADRAEALLQDGPAISVQVLNEFASVARRKLGLQWDEIGDVLAAVRAGCKVHALTEEVHDRGRGIAARHGFAFYDSLIVASALTAGCGVLYTEDLQHGQTIDRTLKIQDPFRE